MGFLIYYRRNIIKPLDINALARLIMYSAKQNPNIQGDT